jgi:hypothetical protein
LHIMLAAVCAASLLLLLPSRPADTITRQLRPRPAVRTAMLSMAAPAEKPKGFAPRPKDGKGPKDRRRGPKPKEITPENKPKAMTDRFDMQFTCNLCNMRNEHSISRHAYRKGTVIVTCPGCNATHLVADNLNWIEDDFVNLEEFMAKQGKPVTRIAKDGVAAAAAAAAAPPMAEAEEPGAAAPSSEKLDGISDDQAARIRDAVRRNKKRNRAD